MAGGGSKAVVVDFLKELGNEQLGSLTSDDVSMPIHRCSLSEDSLD